MKKVILFFAIVSLLSNFTYSQSDSISDQIKIERDIQLNLLNDKLKNNEEEVKILTERIATAALDKEKIASLEMLQLRLDERLKILEEAPKTKINLNGQLAFTELLSIQRDLEPAKLFQSSIDFFDQLASMGNLKKYPSFNSWKEQYDKWYTTQNKNDQMLQLLNSSITLISDVANQVPLYGSIVQTASSGISTVISNLGSRHKDLVGKTPSMLLLLNTTSQFENQKAIIDHEWELINKELMQLQKENAELLNEQLNYYGIKHNDFDANYMSTSLDDVRDRFKNKCRETINDKLIFLESDLKTKGKWMGQVETFMYKVQSLRLRFGQLTNRMLSNLDRYESLISIFSDSSKFPVEFTNEINGLEDKLNSVRKNFSVTFKSEKYIEDSAIMYIERQ